MATSSTVIILIVDKNGIIKEQTINYDENELYKKAGFKTNTDFKLHTEWNTNVNDKNYCIRVYGKTKGQAKQENKYEFPPPIDNTLFFGSCIIVNTMNDIPINISIEEWEAVYENLYGGFEDINDEDTTESDDEDNYDLPQTKYGYVKDGFVVDDDEGDGDDEDENDSDDDDDEEEVTYKKKRNIKNKKKANIKINKKSSKKLENDINVLEFTDELSEEEYV